MGAAAKNGLVYVCNPNNPTASITPKSELRDFIAKTPGQTTILVDEAYFHYADGPDYESVIPLVKDHPNLIVARTFSKIYGMAGLRCGYCVAQKETIERMHPYQMWDSVNCMALAAAIASVNDPDQVANAKRLNSEAKSFVIADTRNVAVGEYVSVTISPGVIVLMPAISHPPATMSSADGMLPPHRFPLPNGSAHTKLVVLLYGWS